VMSIDTTGRQEAEPKPEASQHSPEIPTLRGRLVALRPMMPDDLPALYRLSIDETVNAHWRFRGIVPTYQQFINSTTANEAIVQFVVTDLSGTAGALGLAVAYNADIRSGFAYIGTMVAPNISRWGAGIEATALLTRYLFSTWPFRKLYFELIEYNCERLGSALDGYMTLEGRMREHYYYGGRYWDNFLFAIERQAAETWNATLLPSATGSLL
jgi:RimJ/RimL family protein N-acetyltransferase